VPIWICRTGYISWSRTIVDSCSTSDHHLAKIPSGVRKILDIGEYSLDDLNGVVSFDLLFQLIIRWIIVQLTD